MLIFSLQRVSLNGLKDGIFEATSFSNDVSFLYIGSITYFLRNFENFQTHLFGLNTIFFCGIDKGYKPLKICCCG
jgi:hypothetical protein